MEKSNGDKFENNQTPFDTINPHKKTDERNFLSNEILNDYLKALDNLIEKNPLEKTKDLSIILHVIFIYEEDLLKFIENNNEIDKEKKIILKEFSYNIFNSMIEETSNIKPIEIKKTIKNEFEQLLNKLTKIKKKLKDIFNYLDDKDLENIEKILKIDTDKSKLVDIYYQDLIFSLTENMKVEIFPEYFIFEYKKKLNNFFNDLINKEFANNFYESYKNQQPEVKQLKYCLECLIKNKITLFDKKDNKIFDEEILKILMDIFILINFDYTENDEISKRIFLEKLPKYTKIMNLEPNFGKNRYNYYDDLIQKNNSLLNEHKFDIYFEIENVFFELNNMLKNNFDKYYMIIFSFSLMLNDIVSYGDDDILGINPSISLCSRERQFLLNFLKEMNNYMKEFNNIPKYPFHLNSLMESLVIKGILKSFNTHIYDFDENKKIDIDNKLLIDCITSDSGETNGIDKRLSLKIEEKFSRMQNNLTQNSCINYIFDYVNSFMNLNIDESSKLDISKVKLKSFNNFNLSSNISIFFSGFLTDGVDEYIYWRNFKNGMDENRELYSFQWPSSNYLEVTNHFIKLFSNLASVYISYKNYNFLQMFSNMKNISKIKNDNLFTNTHKISKLCGKLLAYVLAKKNIFKIQSLNLIGFSLGCQIIKSFLKELHELSQDDKTGELNDRLVNLIQNVVFLGGAVDFRKTQKWGIIFQTFVAGKVYNIYSTKDEVLNKLFKIAKPNSQPIGNRKMEFENCKKIENHDVSDKIDGHMNYKNFYDLILNDIDFNI